MNLPIAQLLAVMFLGTTTVPALAEIPRISPSHHAIDALPDSIGRAGMVAATLPDQGEQEIVLAAGGANFPHAIPGAKTAAERGEKVFHDDIYLLRDGHWSSAGQLPHPLGYAAFAGTPRGLVIAGGCNSSGHLKDCMIVSLKNDGKTTIQELPSLPHPVAYPAFALAGNTLYLIGGQLAPDSTEALNSMYSLKLDTPSPQWEKLPDMPGPGRILATGAYTQGKIFVMGGCSLTPDAKGQAERNYLSSVQTFDTATRQWNTKSTSDIPETLVASANPAPISPQGTILLIAGDPGNYYRATLQNKAPSTHPGQSNTIYSFDPATNTWNKIGQWPIGIATAPAVIYRGDILTISGETHPGIRTAITGSASYTL